MYIARDVHYNSSSDTSKAIYALDVRLMEHHTHNLSSSAAVEEMGKVFSLF